MPFCIFNNFLVKGPISTLYSINKLHISYPVRFIFNLTNRYKNHDISTQNKNLSLISLSEEVNSDYIKYFKYKKDLMKSFKQGYIKRVRLSAPNNRKYIKIRDRKRN
ncbi:hypothetical protein TOT_010000580 [Theileria orientalis strain Shintoku]|uniref:Uncharacterized protein n=1 Tax=Theileria orientalis strain Shintoku TaxID=869250 RepID=J4C7I9_THEOR|nr:hypothetical protein TOT_010000580 [Theileria orientalis strain Shintoku]PVC52842.1 hypothetical protein MACL_00000477 [Theileria orientalis]BAM39118.1 hypothetical protein TOT_010000580 [Theileria orientalis strain Shintoku]|eukprot:XP_009689419.1 hypothetical protein TOT_010000580 [Theileria orientalis strain Shintoku]